MKRTDIEHYSSGGEKVRLAVRGLTAEDLTIRPEPEAKIGLWSIHEVVCHLADCEQVYADRMKRVIAEDNPMLLAFDENKWAASLGYARQSTEDTVALLDLIRRQMGRLFMSLPPAAFDRAGTHTESGRQTLADLITKATWHLDHHLKFVHQKRAAMGKEMW